MKNKIINSVRFATSITLLTFYTLSQAGPDDKLGNKSLREANLRVSSLEQQVAALQSKLNIQAVQLEASSSKNACSMSDMPYADPGSYDSDQDNAIQQLAKKIIRDKSDAAKYTNNNLMYYVAEGGYQQAILNLARSFDYNKVVFEGSLDSKKYNCKITSGFWVKGRDFASLSEQILKPYRIAMTIHTPDSVVVMKRLGKKHPCKSK